MPVSPTNDTENPWDFFDRIYCITMTERADRRRQAELEFAKVGLQGRVNFVAGRRHPRDSEQGIYESHVACLGLGLADNARSMIVFEDDVVFERFSKRHLAQCVAFLRRQADWQAFFFGCLVKSSRKTPYPGVAAVAYRSLAHAYAIQACLAEKLVHQPWRGLPFDAMLAGQNRMFYAAFPSFAFQSAVETDNTARLGLDRMRRWFGGLKRIQKVNEWTRRHMALLIVAHVIGLGILIAAGWVMITR